MVLAGLKDSSSEAIEEAGACRERIFERVDRNRRRRRCGMQIGMAGKLKGIIRGMAVKKCAGAPSSPPSAK